MHGSLISNIDWDEFIDIFIEIDCVVCVCNGWITNDIYSSNNFISASVKYTIGYWGSVTPWMVFHWTILCRCCYCTVECLEMRVRIHRCKMILYPWSQFPWECDECYSSHVFHLGIPLWHYPLGSCNTFIKIFHCVLWFSWTGVLGCGGLYTVFYGYTEAQKQQ